MPPTLPPSLSPHICVLTSPDLQDLLERGHLPPLHDILQSFAPLQQVTTRTTALTSVPHASFALRFSDLVEIEQSSHEDQGQRADRTIDWISSRIASRAAQWVDAVETSAGKPDSQWKDRTPWWEEVKRCVEGDCVPNKSEGWNHPIAVIYAVSTAAVNPLQALQDLHSRPLDFPPWIDGPFLRYSLIVHPSNSPLSDSIAESLFNAVKKQHGLHTYLLSLTFPDSPPPLPVNLPPPPPRLPPLASMELSPMPSSQIPSGLGGTISPTPVLSAPSRPSSSAGDRAIVNGLALNDNDIQQFGRFVREFVVMSLVPWMEKCVIDWNESYSSSRRLPSRLFSSTRRLFGSSYTASAPATPTHGSNPSISSVTSRFNTHAANSSVSSLASITSATSGTALALGGVSQQRRLAEFATILGDFKLAITVWESLRKESKGGSDILPLLLAPGPTLCLLASNAITTLYTLVGEMPAYAQLRALVYSVRWDIGIDRRDFLGSILEGERWLVQASGTADEPPTAILLAHAAFLSTMKNAKRRAALWYLQSADRLEKAGIKPLALYFFRQSHQLYRWPSVEGKELSPSFWESECRDPANWVGFEAILSGIEHELGRLLYNTGDTESAVRYFIGLLRESVQLDLASVLISGQTNGDLIADTKIAIDRVYLEDFRVALKHFRTTNDDHWLATKHELRLPSRLCQAKESHLRLPGDAVLGDPEKWKSLEQDWEQFWRPRGKEQLSQGGKAAVNEPFWLDLVVKNPLNVEVTLTNLTLVVRDESSLDTPLAADLVNVEVVNDITLGAKEKRTIPISISCTTPMTLTITDVTYDFLSLLPVCESLAVRGRRLHDTTQQRQSKVYALDVLIKIEVEDSSLRLQASFVDNRYLVLAHGERKRMSIALRNSGTKAISELWLSSGPYDQIWVDIDNHSSSESATAVFHSRNSLVPSEPYRLPLEHLHTSTELGPGETLHLPLNLHAAHLSDNDLNLLIVYRDHAGDVFHSSRLSRHYEVRRILTMRTSHGPRQIAEEAYTMNVEIENIAASSLLRIQQITTMSPSWTCRALTEEFTDFIAPHQVTRVSFAVQRTETGIAIDETYKFLIGQLQSLLKNAPVESVSPPPIELHCRHLSKDNACVPIDDPATRHFINNEKKATVACHVASLYSSVSKTIHWSIFPLYDPLAIDILVFWEIPMQNRYGHILIPGPKFGVRHAPLKEIIEEAENAKVKRSMYAETQKERADVLDTVRNSEWNAESNPLVVTVEDGSVVTHDFDTGPCNVPVSFILHNGSPTNPLRYTLKLSSGVSQTSRSSSTLLAPSYGGRLTHRGVLAPLKSRSISAKLCARNAGCYALDGWTVETEVGEASSDAHWRTRQRYQQNPPTGSNCCITIVAKT